MIRFNVDLDLQAAGKRSSYSEYGIPFFGINCATNTVYMEWMFAFIASTPGFIVQIKENRIIKKIQVLKLENNTT